VRAWWAADCGADEHASDNRAAGERCFSPGESERAVAVGDAAPELESG
jgi:hypothetical protein